MTECGFENRFFARMAIQLTINRAN